MSRQTALKSFGIPVFAGADWRISQWRSVDDRVRGGISQSYFQADGLNARFYGTLDTKTLGGAGFCSQQFWFDGDVDVSQYPGIMISIGKTDGKKYAINLSDVRSGNEGSQVNYKATFEGFVDQVDLKWSDFKPYYRGRPQDGRVFDPKKLAGISIMMQSFFDEQSGEFDLTLKSIEYLQ